MKKKLIVLSASLLAAVIGSVIVHGKKANEKQAHFFVGTWFYYDRNQEKIKLALTNDLQLYVQNKLEPTDLLEDSNNRLVLRDSLGYEIIFKRQNNEISFYDEAEDLTFPLVKS